MIETDFTEFIDQYRGALPSFGLEQLLEQRRLSAAKKAG
jgi:hypothetical protein